MKSLIAAIAVAVIIAGAAIVSCSSPAPARITVHGTVEATTTQEGAVPSDVYPDVRDGSQVVVIDSAGSVIATSAMSFRNAAMLGGDFEDYFTFTVIVPGGQPRYGIQAGHNHGTVWFDATEMRAGPGICIGDGC